MSRYRVVFHEGEFYHVYNLGAGHARLFQESENYLFLLRQLKLYSQKLSITVIAHCLLPNHYHFLFRQDGADSAGVLIQRVFNSYTKAYNKRYERTGTLFEGRYRAIHITEDEYLLHLCRYIHANPVRHGVVSRLEEWPYSNYPEWLGLRNGELWDPAFVGTHFSDRASYGRFVWKYLAQGAALPDDLAKYLASLDD